MMKTIATWIWNILTCAFKWIGKACIFLTNLLKKWASKNRSPSVENSLPDDYFSDVPEDLIDFIETSGTNALLERKGTHDKIREDCRRTLALFLSGVGLSLGLTISLAAAGQTSAAKILTVCCLWICYCSIYLLKFCIQSKKQPPVYTEPDRIYDAWAKENQPQLDVVRRRHLITMQRDIEHMISINNQMIKELNNARWLAAATPVLALVATLFYV